MKIWLTYNDPAYSMEMNYYEEGPFRMHLVQAEDDIQARMECSSPQVILNELTDQAMQTENSSVRRLTLNIIEHLTLEEDDLWTDFLDFCFEHMASIKQFPGIQTLCMKLAYRMCSFYPELMDELKHNRCV